MTFSPISAVIADLARYQPAGRYNWNATIPRCGAKNVRKLVGILASFVTACASPSTSDPVDRSATSVDRAIYRLSSQGSLELRVRFKNETLAPAYLGHCGDETLVSLERAMDGSWRALALPDCPLFRQEPTVVANGATFDFPLKLMVGPNLSRDDLAGTLRIRVGAYHSAGAAWARDSRLALPDSTRTTQPFTIER